jgi:AcrR family transcriptional regulator
MPTPQKRPAPKRAAAPVIAPSEGLREQRGARRKRETRARLLDAAFNLMAARGADGVTIHEITEAADVATGGFYNHFKSKEDIYFELTKRVFEDFADGLEVLLAGVDDPAEIMAVCVRQTVARAASEPVWGQFLLREGLSSHAFTRGLGSRMRRDIATGVKRGRFKLGDPVMTFIATGGAILAAVAAQVHAAQAARDGGAAATGALSLGKEDVGERIAAIVLQMLGLSASQAERVARRPLPATRAA